MHLELVPQQFIQILKGTIAKMAGEDMIPRDFVDIDFWSKFPTRFNQRKYNDPSKVKKLISTFPLLQKKKKKQY